MPQADTDLRLLAAKVALLTFAILGPVFHWLVILVRGVSFFYVDFTRLILAYLFLSLSAGAAAWTVLRPINHVIRLVAIGGLLLNLSSIAYAGRLWRVDSKQLAVDSMLMPIAEHKNGIIVAPVSDSSQALAEAHAIEEVLVALAGQAEQDLLIEVRQVHALTSHEQAQMMGSRLRASVVIWGTETGSELRRVEHYVTSLGANNAEASLDPTRLVLLLATINTFSVSNNLLASESQVPSIVSEVIAPTAMGYVALAAAQPVLAASYFRSALTARQLTTETLHSLEGFLSLAYIHAGRSDLAQDVLSKTRRTEPDATTWLYSGYLALYENDLDAANDSLVRARELEPRLVQAYCGLGIVASQQRNISRALALYSQAVALQPSWGIPYVLLAQANELAGNMNAAMAAYERARTNAYPFTNLLDLVSQRSLMLAQNPPTPVPTAVISPTASPMPIPGVRYHTVVKGETLQKIATKYNITVEIIVKANKLEDLNVLYVGQVLIIPDE